MSWTINTFLEEIEKKTERATAGPWIVKDIHLEGWQHYKMVNGYQRSVQYRDFITESDAEFISISRTSVPSLVNVIKDLQKFIEKSYGEEQIKALDNQLTRRFTQP